jgi:hypothetical protein
VFEGYGVGLTVAARSDVETALELQRVDQLEAMLVAYRADLVMGLAVHRADEDADGRSPVPGTSEFFVDELAVISNSSARSAARLAGESYVLVQRLPAVWAALVDCELDVSRARMFVDVLGPTAAGVAEAVSAQLLPEAAGLSLGKVRARRNRAALAVDARFAEEKRKQAERRTDVRLYRTDAGMAELSTEMPAALAAACWSTVDELAWMAKNDGDPRPIGQLRAGVLADLILRPWDTSRPAVTAQLTVVAPLDTLIPGAAGTAEVDGQRSPPRTCGSCWNSWTRSARAGSRRRPAGLCRSRSPTPTERCGRRPAAGSRSAGSTSTTSRPIRRAPPTAPTSAACAGATTGSRPMPPAGGSPPPATPGCG